MKAGLVKTVGVATFAIALAALAQVHPLAPLAAVLVLAAGGYVLSSPFRLLLLFGSVLFLRPSEVVPALEPLSLAKLLALSAVGLFVLSRMWTRDLRVARSPFHLPMAALVAAVLASSLLGVNVPESTAQFNDVFVKIVVVYVLVVHLVDGAPRIAAVHASMALTTTVMALYSMHARATGEIVVEGSRAAYVGALGDPNDFSLVLFMYVPFLAEAVMATRGPRRAALGAMLLVLLAGMAATQSRGGFLGIALAALIAFHDRGSLRVRIAAVPIATVVLVGLVLISGATERQSGAVGGDGIDESAQGRLDAWGAAVRMLMRHPLLGVGFGRFAESYERFAINPVIWGQHETHNAYLKVAAETGLAGLVPFLVLVGLTLRTAARLRRVADREAEPVARAALRAALPGAAGFCLMTWFLSQCWSWGFYILFAQVAAMGRLYGVDGAGRGERAAQQSSLAPVASPGGAA